LDYSLLKFVAKILNGVNKRRFEGPEKVVLADLLEFIKVHDPEVILFPYADARVPLIVKKARCYDPEPTFSRSSWFRWPPSPNGDRESSTTRTVPLSSRPHLS